MKAQVVECVAANSNTNSGEHISRFTHHLLRVAVERDNLVACLLKFQTSPLILIRL